MTHADVIRAKRDAVVEAAKAFVSDRDADSDLVALEQSVDALASAEQAACGECGGSGRRWLGSSVYRIPLDGSPGYWECPSCHGTGRKPDTFRDDAATTPEGHEEQQGS